MGKYDELVMRLSKKERCYLPANWQKGLKCPECASVADRPKCFYELGGSCPRHDPDNYEPSPYVTVPDKDCSEAATAIATLEAELAAMKARGDRLAEALEPFVTGAAHTRIFLQSRERMHPAGQDLYDEDVATAHQALTEWRDQ